MVENLGRPLLSRLVRALVQLDLETKSLLLREVRAQHVFVISVVCQLLRHSGIRLPVLRNSSVSALLKHGNIFRLYVHFRLGDCYKNELLAIFPCEPDYRLLSYQQRQIVFWKI